MFLFYFLEGDRIFVIIFCLFLSLLEILLPNVLFLMILFLLEKVKSERPHLEDLSVS